MATLGACSAPPCLVTLPPKKYDKNSDCLHYTSITDKKTNCNGCVLRSRGSFDLFPLLKETIPQQKVYGPVEPQLLAFSFQPVDSVLALNFSVEKQLVLREKSKKLVGQYFNFQQANCLGQSNVYLLRATFLMANAMSSCIKQLLKLIFTCCCCKIPDRLDLKFLLFLLLAFSALLAYSLDGPTQCGPVHF